MHPATIPIDAPLFWCRCETNHCRRWQPYHQPSGRGVLRGRQITVPHDPSSAAFAVVAALITPDSDVIIPGIGMNPLRTGLLDTLIEMGGSIERFNERTEGGEPIADLHVKSSQLHGIHVPASRAAS